MPPPPIGDDREDAIISAYMAKGPPLAERPRAVNLALATVLAQSSASAASAGEQWTERWTKP